MDRNSDATCKPDSKKSHQVGRLIGDSQHDGLMWLYCRLAAIVPPARAMSPPALAIPAQS